MLGLVPAKCQLVQQLSLSQPKKKLHVRRSIINGGKHTKGDQRNSKKKTPFFFKKKEIRKEPHKHAKKKTTAADLPAVPAS